MKNANKVVKVPGMSILKSEVEGKAFDSVKKKYPHADETKLKQLWDLANPAKETEVAPPASAPKSGGKEK